MPRPRTTSSRILNRLSAGPALLSELARECEVKPGAIRSTISRLRDQHYEIIGSNTSRGWLYEWLKEGKRG